MASWEEASRCPKCSEPGEKVRSHSAGRGNRVHVLFCRNERCSWLDTSWIVQVDSNGEIPERKAGPKQFEGLSEMAKARARREIEDLQIADPTLRRYSQD